MYLVLVVDDSVSDRSLAQEYMKQDPDLEVVLVDNASGALEAMENRLPDIVLTDLRMPGMDGLELVSQIKNRFPLVPIVLMTSQGSEEIAVSALQRGAASYVPKSCMADDLVPTIRDLLEVSHWERGRSRLLENLAHSRFEFQLPNDRTLIVPLVGYLQQQITQRGICDESQKMHIGVALEEALANAYYHGNLEVCSELKEDDYEAYEKLSAERAVTSPYCDRSIFVTAEFTPDEAKIVIRDEGPGFDPGSLPDPTDPANLERASGRGVLLMRTFMDDIQYNDQGNEVTMVKRRKSPDDAS